MVETAFHEYATEEEKVAYHKAIEEDNNRVKEIVLLAVSGIPKTLRDFMIVRQKTVEEAKEAFEDYLEKKQFRDAETGTVWFNK